MTPGRWRLAVFALVCAAQLAVAASIIVGAERVLGEGELWRFRTAPIDPVDLVRGRYVALSFEAVLGPVLPGETLVEGGDGYALLEADAEGFARVAGVRATPPEQGAYLAVKLRNVAPTTVSFDFPVDRFYLPEQQAPVAERAHADAQRSGRASWAEVRVHEGRAMIEQLFIDGVPAGEVVAPEPTAVPEPLF